MGLTSFIVSALVGIAGSGDKSVTTDLGDGYVRVKTPDYSVDVPKGWLIGDQTPWGARAILPKEGSQAELGVMTAGITKQSWESLYETSLFFILRQEKGKATPYKISKLKNGYEACRFEVVDETNFAKRRYVLLKSTEGRAIALSVIITNKANEKQIVTWFNRMVESAKIG
jgi:hypothetical protein